PAAASGGGLEPRADGRDRGARRGAHRRCVARSDVIELSSTRVQAEDEDAAIEWLHANRRTDGLPVVVPTPTRVAALLESVPLDPAESLGRIGPAMADATVEKVAICAVMAGCRPEHMPVLLAAVRAVCDPVLDMSEV